MKYYFISKLQVVSNVKRTRYFIQTEFKPVVRDTIFALTIFIFPDEIEFNALSPVALKVAPVIPIALEMFIDPAEKGDVLRIISGSH